MPKQSDILLDEQSHRIPNITSAYSANYSHMDGNNMDGRWRDDGDGDGDDLPFNPRPDRVPEHELLVPEIGFEVAAAFCIFSGKTIGGFDVFRSNEVNRRNARRQPSHHLAR